MEILLDEPINLEQVVYLCAIGMKRKPPTPRNFQTWHVSNLLQAGHSIAKGDVRYPEYEGEIKGIMSFGSLWELMVDHFLTHYGANLGGLYVPDVESVKDGVLGSLDGLLWLPSGVPVPCPASGWMVCETKLRFSLNSEIPLSHLQQVRAYCHLAETDTVCYISGHIISNPPTAQARMRIIRFAEQSIQETWQGIIRTKEFLAGQGCCPEGVK